MSACRCTDTEVCFPCRDREARVVAAAECFERRFDVEFLRAAVFGTEPPPPAEAPDWPVDGSGLCTRHGHRSTENGYGEMVCLTCADERRAADAPDVEPATSQVSSSREVQPAIVQRDRARRRVGLLEEALRQANADRARLRGQVERLEGEREEAHAQRDVLESRLVDMAPVVDAVVTWSQISPMLYPVEYERAAGVLRSAIRDYIATEGGE